MSPSSWRKSSRGVGSSGIAVLSGGGQGTAYPQRQDENQLRAWRGASSGEGRASARLAGWAASWACRRRVTAAVAFSSGIALGVEVALDPRPGAGCRLRGPRVRRPSRSPARSPHSPGHRAGGRPPCAGLPVDRFRIGLWAPHPQACAHHPRPQFGNHLLVTQPARTLRGPASRFARMPRCLPRDASRRRPRLRR